MTKEKAISTISTIEKTVWDYLEYCEQNNLFTEAGKEVVNTTDLINLFIAEAEYNNYFDLPEAVILNRFIEHLETAYNYEIFTESHTYQHFKYKNRNLKELINGEEVRNIMFTFSEEAGFVFLTKEQREKQLSNVKVLKEREVINKKEFYESVIKYCDKNNISKKDLRELLQEVVDLIKTEENKKLPDRIKINASLPSNILKQVLPNINKADRIKNTLIECNKDIIYETIQGFTYQKNDREGNVDSKIQITFLNDIKSLNKGQSGKFDKFFNFLMYCYNGTDTTKTLGYIFIPYDLYLKYTGRSTTPRMIKQAKKEIKDYMEFLMKINVIAKIKGKKHLDGIECKPFVSCDRAKYKDGAEIGMGQKFIDLIGQDFYSTPFRIGKLSENAFQMADFIYYHWKINRKESGKAYNIKLSTLYEKTNLPSFETVKNEYCRHYDLKIYEPLDKAIHEIRENLKGEIEIGEYKAPEELKDLEQYIEIKAFNIEDYTETRKKADEHRKKAKQIKENNLANKIN